MREIHPTIESLGAHVIVVGTGADWQAERLMADGMPFECLVNPDANLYRTLGIGRVGLSEWLRPSTIRRYVRAYRRGGRQGHITGDWRRLSGVAVIDADRRLRWSYVAEGVGDYPSTADVVAALAALEAAREDS